MAGEKGGIQEIIQSLVVRAGSVKAERQRKGNWGGGVAPHAEYRTRPTDWLVEKLGFKREDIEWSLRPAYENHSWVGTKDPLAVALQGLADSKWVGVESGSGTNKTYTLAAGASLWFLACWENARVFSLAPKEDQLTLNMWKEITKMWPRFQAHFPTAELTTLCLRVRGGIDDTWAAHGMVAKVGADETVAGRARGFHEAHQLIILEEGPNVDSAIWQTCQTTSGGAHNIILGLGNPDSVHDPLHRFCEKSRVVPVQISCWDHPNVVCDDPWLIPGATSRQWIEDRTEEWGEASNAYQRFVNGFAPAQSEDALIEQSWIDAAVKRFDDPFFREGPLALGVDVADNPKGDACAISRWQGSVCTQVQEFRVDDASIAGRFVFKEMRNPDARVDPKRVGIDDVGVGVSAVNELTRLGVRVRRISGGKRAMAFVDVEAHPDQEEQKEGQVPKKAKRKIVVEPPDFDNLRSQVFWRLREDLRLGRIGLPDDKELHRELTAHEWTINKKTGKKEVQAKDEVRAKLHKSPNRADCVAYGNWVRWRRLYSAKEAQKQTMSGIDRHFDQMIERQNAHQKGQQREIKRLLRRFGM